MTNTRKNKTSLNFARLEPRNNEGDVTYFRSSFLKEGSSCCYGPGLWWLGAGVAPQGGCLDPAWTWCVHPSHPMVLDLVGPALLLLAAKPLNLCNHLSVSCCDLGAQTHHDRCPVSGYTAWQGQGFSKYSLGIGKEIVQKYLVVTAHHVVCMEPRRQGMLSGKQSGEN